MRRSRGGNMATCNRRCRFRFNLFLGLSFLWFTISAFGGTASAQPPAFVTLPRHPAIDAVTGDSGHPMPFRLELKNEMYEMVGKSAPSGGGAKGAGGKGGGGGADFGQNAAVAMTPNCFANSLNNFDVSCAEAVYQ